MTNSTKYVYYTIEFPSHFELSYAIFFDYYLACVDWIYQPSEISLEYEGRSISFIPDFLISLSYGIRAFIHISPKKPTQEEHTLLIKFSEKTSYPIYSIYGEFENSYLLAKKKEIDPQIALISSKEEGEYYSIADNPYLLFTLHPLLAVKNYDLQGAEVRPHYKQTNLHQFQVEKNKWTIAERKKHKKP